MAAEDIHLTSLAFREDTSSTNLHLLPLAIKESEPEVVVVSEGEGGGGAILIVPKPIAKAEIKIKVIRLQRIVSKLKVIVNHLRIKSKIPVKIRNVTLSLSLGDTSLTLRSFIKSLTLNIRTSELNLDEDKS